LIRSLATRLLRVSLDSISFLTCFFIGGLPSSARETLPGSGILAHLKVPGEVPPSWRPGRGWTREVARSAAQAGGGQDERLLSGWKGLTSGPGMEVAENLASALQGGQQIGRDVGLLQDLEGQGRGGRPDGAAGSRRDCRAPEKRRCGNDGSRRPTRTDRARRLASGQTAPPAWQARLRARADTRGLQARAASFYWPWY
jgi:hypothetical protein